MQRQQSELHGLLTHAFDGWGSMEYFEWKYPQYPNYDPVADNFTITNDTGQIIAARRVFRHRLQTPDGKTLSAHIHGGTAVHEAYRGRGYYTTLLEESMETSTHEADIILTFNRAGKITTKHHKKNGWNWLQLPIYAQIISPSRVFSHYITDSDLVEKVANQVSTIDRKLTTNQFIAGAMASIVDQIYGRSEQTTPTGSVGSTTTVKNGLVEGNTTTVPNYEISRIDGPVPEAVVEELHKRLAEASSSLYCFDRSIENIRHCLSYPQSTVFVARETDTERIIDFVIAGTLLKGELTECRVLEQTWGQPAVTQELFGAVDRYGRETGADVIVACSKRQPGPHWVSLGTESMMWPPDTDQALPTDPDAWRITMYDIL